MYKRQIFNIATTIILLPFSNTLVKIAKKLVTTDNADGQDVYKRQGFQQMTMNLSKPPAYTLHVLSECAVTPPTMLWSKNYAATSVSYTHLDVYKRQHLP